MHLLRTDRFGKQSELRAEDTSVALDMFGLETLPLRKTEENT